MHRNHVFIIAEAGVNHNGSVERAIEMIRVAANAGVDAVKFQAFRAESMVTRGATKAPYQREGLHREESQFAMLKRLQLGHDAQRTLKTNCEHLEIKFLSSPFDLEAVDLLVDLGLDTWKVPSGEITNLPYLRKIGALDQHVILSTGMATLIEIEAAVDVIKRSGTRSNRISLLHCNSAYPTPMQDVNLRAIQTLREHFDDVRIGFSDHTQGIVVPIAAVAVGAQIIEKHFTMDRNLPGPDHKASLEPDELAAMVRAIRDIEQAIGDGVKKPSPSESENLNAARKSIVAARDIVAGETFSEANLAVKRPALGLSPMKWDDVVGRQAKRDYVRDEPIQA